MERSATSRILQRCSTGAKMPSGCENVVRYTFAFSDKDNIRLGMTIWNARKRGAAMLIMFETHCRFHRYHKALARRGGLVHSSTGSK